MALSVGAKIGIAALTLFLLSKVAKAAGPKMVTVQASTGKKQAKFSSYDGDTAAWAKKRFGAAHDYLTGSLGMTDPKAKEMALSALAHWSLETAGGANESNFNVGNIHAGRAQGYFESGDTDKMGKSYTAQFASYDGLIAGIKAYFDLISSGAYVDCWAALKSQPTEADWFKCLGRHGYYAATMKGKDNIEPAAASWASRRALLAQYAEG